MAKTKSRKQIEREAREETSARLAYIGTLASGLAHEIRTPLSSIVMNAELLAEDARSMPDEQCAEVLKRAERIRTEAASLRETLDEFLAFARPPKMEFVPTKLNEWLEEVIEFAEPECAGHDIRIERDLSEGLFPVLIDQGQFGQVFMNLISNARDSIGEHGTITVSTWDDDRWVHLRITDDGGGLPPEVEGRIFDIFFTTKKQGSGLGLGIARRIVHEHGGTLTLENLPGRGASFVARLPKGRFLEYREGPDGRSAAGDGAGGKER